MQEKLPVALSALRESFVARAARMEVREAWQVAAHFGSVDAEVEAARTAVAVGEAAGSGVWEVEGAELADLATRLGVGEVPIGAGARVTLPSGGEARWCRLTRSRPQVLMEPERARGDARQAVRAALASALSSLPGAERSPLPANGRCLRITDVSSGLTTLVILGPRSPDLLARLLRVDVDPRVFADRTLALTGAVGVPLQLLRWDHGSLLAYELMVGRDVAEYFWGTLVHAGIGLEWQPFGVEALSRLLAE